MPTGKPCSRTQQAVGPWGLHPTGSAGAYGKRPRPGLGGSWVSRGQVGEPAVPPPRVRTLSFLRRPSVALRAASVAVR